MDLKEYAKQRSKYKRFAEHVKTILNRAIKDANKQGNYRYNLQHIQCRAKTLKSLTQRLIEAGKEDAKNIEEIRGDLAGCRVIFYYNNDVNAFVNSGMIFHLFKVDRNSIKVHGPLGPVESANEEYTAFHYSVELTDEASSDSRRKQYKGMKCEVQIQTILNHAFNETIHDILYKKPNEKNFGSEVLKSIDKLMQKVMREYLRPAGHQLQNAKNDQKRLLEGKILFDRDLSQRIISAENNNDRYELLNNFYHNTLPLCDDEYFEQEINSIIAIAATGINHSQYVDPVPMRITWREGSEAVEFNGKIFKDILRVSLDILYFVRYINPEKIFNCMIECYQRVTSDDEKDLIEEYVLKLIEYRVEVLKKAGIVIQRIILEQIESAASEVIKVIKPVVISVCGAILNPVAEGTSSSYMTITMIQGCLPGNQIVSDLRARSLQLLMRLYDSKAPEAIKNKIFNALQNGTRLPSRGDYSDELMEVILRNCIDLLNFYTSLINDEKYERLSAIEHDVVFLYNRSRGILESKREFSVGCKEASRVLIQRALDFKNKLNEDRDYVVYKTLVGYGSVFDQDWNDNWSYTEKNKYREEIVFGYVGKIQVSNEDYWRKMVLRCAVTQFNSGGNFFIFEFFLKLLGRFNPKFIFKLLNGNEETLSNFIPYIINGLLNSDFRDDALEKIKIWVADGKHLSGCALSYRLDQPFDVEILSLILSKAIEMQDNIALRAVISSIPKNYTADNKVIVQAIFIPAVEAMINLNDANWIDSFYYQANGEKIISSLDEKDADIVLNSLLSRHKVDYHTEAILTPIAEKYPEKIYEYFSNRISLYEREKRVLKDYDPIPYDDFVDLMKPLAKNPKMAILQMKRWYSDNPDLFFYRGARLVHKIFPNFLPHFEAELIELIKSESEDDLKMVVALLRLYKGAAAIIDSCREIIKRLPEGSDKLDEIRLVLDQTGVLSGDYGSVDACEEKMQQISPWLQDPDKKIRVFAEQYTKSLQMRAKYEQQRAEQRIEQMKHQYGDEE